MLRSLAAGQAAPQLLAAARAGTCGLLGSGVLRRGLAAMVEPTAFPPADRDSFHYAVLQAPLMQVGSPSGRARGGYSTGSPDGFFACSPALSLLPHTPA